MSEIFDIHIWELPEKTDDIDKSKEYLMIHDGYALKKVTAEKLYEYFGQNYKIENMVNYFDLLLELDNIRYSAFYFKLDESTEFYEKIVKNLYDKFIINRDDIRSLETSINQISTDISILTKSQSNLKSKFSKLHEKIDELNTITDNIKNRNTDVMDIAEDLVTTSEIINSDKEEIASDNVYIKASISRISNHEDQQLHDKAELLSNNINIAYDKIVSIIDKCHHDH